MKYPEKDKSAGESDQAQKEASVFSLQTTSPEILEEWVAPYSPRVRVHRLRKDFRAEVVTARLKNLSLYTVDYAAIGVHGTEPHGYLGLNIPLEGQFKTYNNHVYNKIYCSQGDETFDLEGDRGKVLVANFDLDAIKKLLVQSYNWGGELPFFPKLINMDDPKVKSFAGYLRRVHTDLTQENPLMRSPKMCAQLENALFTALLEIGMSQESDLAGTSFSGGDQPYLARAEEYLRAHLEEGVTLLDLAEAVEVSTRSLTRAFKAKHGVGPMAFYKSLRLEVAFRDLRAATPRQGKVLEVAIKYGFYSQGRFAADYQKKFGEKPSQTLWR